MAPSNLPIQVALVISTLLLSTGNVKNGQPEASTTVLAGVSGHLSSSFRTPSPFFTLPADNNKVEITSATCIDNNDGSIGLSIEDASHDYTITITGQSDVKISGDDKTATVTGLAKGSYTVCFKVDGQSAYELSLIHI